jgi:hypothetical protein
MKSTIITLLVLFAAACGAQAQQPQVLTLGTFHFAFPNRDLKTTAAKDQIDVLDPPYQRELEEIVEKLARFRPTIIAIERDPQAQHAVDSLYRQYLSGTYQLGRGEEEQIGFRLAKRCGLSGLFCVNDWGAHYEHVSRIIDGRDSAGLSLFEEYYYHNPDSLKKSFPKDVFKSRGILAELRSKNDEAHVRRDLGNYLVGIFKYETKEDRYLGVDFTTGQWFSRNLRIFRNIQRLNAGPSDRILVIFGAGHLNLLNPLFDASPEFRRVRTNDFLR